MLRRILNVVVCSSLLLTYSPAQAEFDETSLLLQLSGDEELISIATGTPRPISKAAAVASVITAADIKASGAKTVIEALESIPGLHISPSSLSILQPIFSLRGIHTGTNPQTLILFDGNESPFSFTGGLLPKINLPVENIARIEVIRGPGSAIYGANAFSGVINIITKTDADIDGFHAGIKAGSFDTQQVWGQYGGVHNGWHIASSIEVGHSNGDRGRTIDSDLQTVLDAALGTSASLAPGALDTRYESLVSGLSLKKGAWSLQFNSWNQRDTGVGAGVTNALDPAGFTDLEQYIVDINYNKKDWLPNWSLELNAVYSYNNVAQEFFLFPPGALLPIGSDGNLNFVAPAGLVQFTDGLIGNPSGLSESSNFSITSFYKGMQDHLWRFNGGLQRISLTAEETKNFGPSVINGSTSPIDGTLTNVTGTPFIYVPDESRTIQYVSIQDEWAFAPDWTFTGGLRYDNYSDVGSTVNPRLSLVWNTRQDLTTKLLYGRAFRAPSFAELRLANNPVVIGNPNLVPEVIDTLELAFSYKYSSRLNSTLNLFHYRIKGLINFVDDDGVAGGSSTAQNNIDQSASGLELELNWQASNKLRLSGNLALQNATDDDTGDKIADAPRKQLQFTANWRFKPQWTAQMDAFRIMDRPRAASDNRDKIDDYTWVNLTVNGRKVVNDVDVQFAVRNLFNTDAREPGPTSIANDYPLEGRSFHLGISTTF